MLLNIIKVDEMNEQQLERKIFLPISVFAYSSSSII